jgi:polyisoprenoid-binding protein YceI
MRVLLAACLCWIAAAVWAAPQRYALDTANSTVSFGYTLVGRPARGAMPVRAADIVLDVQDFSRSHVTATLDPAAATTGIIFATQAMRGPSVLDVETYPDIRFRSTKVTGSANRGEMDGEITIRGVTRPITLTAQLFTESGRGDLDRVSILLRGSVSRSAFGASGYPSLVGDIVTLDILARVIRVE